jgi:hypothetical protein
MAANRALKKNEFVANHTDARNKLIGKVTRLFLVAPGVQCLTVTWKTPSPTGPGV